MAAFICMALLNVGSFYIYDFPQVLEEVLIDYFKITTVEISYLYSAYSLPNFIAALIGGVILNKIGLGGGSFVFNTILFISALVTIVGMTIKSFWVVIASRVIFGIGGEALYVAQTAIADKWFSGRFLSLAIGISNFFSLFANSSQDFITPAVYLRTGSIITPFYIMAGVSLGSLLLNAVYAIIDKYSIKKLEINQKEKIEVVEFRFKDLLYLRRMYWLLVIMFVLLTSCYYQFMYFATDFFVSRFGLTYENSKDAVSISPFVASILLPIISMLTVIIGKKDYLLLICSILAVFVYGSLYLLPQEPSIWIYFPISGVGLIMAIYSSTLWSGMTLVVPKEAINLALSLASTLLNITWTTLPILFGYLNEQRTPEGYGKSALVLTGIGLFAAIVSIMILYDDARTGGVLHLPENHDRVKLIREGYSAELKRKKHLRCERSKSMISSEKTNTLVEEDNIRNPLNSHGE